VVVRVTALEIGSAEYHGDPCPTPSLSSSICKLLVTASPAHAWANHPRLNPNYAPDGEQKYDVGTVAHALLLQGLETVHIVTADSWRTKAAQEERDQARADGRVPLILSQWENVRAMVDAANRQLDAFGLNPRPFTDGRPEVCLTWETDGVQCRALIDWLHDDNTHISDYKSTSASAHPQAWAKTAMGIGADLQTAFYLAGVEAVYGITPTLRYVVQETYPPYALSVVEPDAEFIALGRDKITAAMKTWRACLASNEWPAYDAKVTPISAPGWAVASWMEREAGL
jgi:hypothetical protein